MRSKRIIALILVGLFSLTLFAGCTGNSKNKTGVKDGEDSNKVGENDEDSGGEDSKLSGSITVLTHRTDMTEVFEGYKEKFESEHPGTNIEFESFTDYQGTLSTRMGTEDYGDVLMIPANITKNQYPDFFEPLGTEEELKKEFNFLDNFNVDGTIYGLSTGANANGFVYNEQVLKDAGVTNIPTTIEEFFDTLKAIKENTDAIPYYTNYVADWALTNFSNALQIGISGDPEYMNKMIYNKNEFSEGSATYTSLKILHDIVANEYCEEDPITSDWEYSKQAMADGKIGVMCLGTWAVGQIQDLSDNPENIKFMPVPVRHDGKAIVQIGSDYGMGVNKHSDNIELAKEFVKFFVREYPNDSNMISSIVGAELPDYLSGADNVELVEPVPGTTKQAEDLDKVQKESLINLSDGTWIQTIVEIGLGNSDLTFDEYMQELNDRWSKAIDALE